MDRRGGGGGGATRPAVTEAPATDPPRTTPTTPPTTVAETTNPPTTPAPAGPVVDAGWRLATMIPEAVIPPFDSPWTGSPSPEITGSSLADGIYYIDYVSGDASSVVFDVGRFESCTVLGDEIACGPPPYDASAVGQVRPPATQVAVPLDDSTRVVVEGWDCAPIVAEGNGADLAAMYEALGADLDVTFEAALSIGGDEYDMMQAVRNDPASPFGPQSAACDDGYSLVWRFGDAPPVLLQQVADFDTGGAKDAGDVLIPTVIEIAGDETTLYFYAGFFS